MFKSRPGDRQSCQHFHGFPLALGEDVGMILETDHDRFLPHPFQCIIHCRPLIKRYRALIRFTGGIIK
jgi:hypothetical protein